MKKKRKLTEKSGFQTIQRLLFGQKKATLSALEEDSLQSPMKTVVHNFFENKTAAVGFFLFLFIIAACFLLALFFPLDASYQDTTQQNIPPGFSMMKYPKELHGTVQTLSVGSTFGAAVDKNGKLYVWGESTDLLKGSMPDEKIRFRSVAAGYDHVLALTEAGKVISFGSKRFQLEKIPQAVKESTTIEQIDASFQYSLALTQEGVLYFWGNSNLVGLTQDSIPAAVQGKIAKVAGNSNNVLLLLRDGSVTTIGAKGTTFYHIPPNMGKIVDIASGDKAAIALSSDGNVSVWGSNEYGLLSVPEGIQGKVKAISAGRLHFTATTNDGIVHAWGRNQFGQTNVPTSLKNVDTVFSGYFQNYAIDTDGKLHTWGLNGYFMGTDGFGRDIFSRLVAGGRLTLTVGAVAVLISVVLGVFVGGIAGYYGGMVDIILMRFAEIVGSIPFLPLAMTLSAVLGNRISENYRIFLIMIILGVLSWSGLAQLVRGQILAEREKDFVMAAKAMGIKERMILFRHIIPNVLTVIIVNATLSYATSLLTESSLSFLGFGVTEPNPTWGNMLTGSQSSTIIGQYWWRWVFPSLALALSTISINLIGDGLRDAIDPKSNER